MEYAESKPSADSSLPLTNDHSPASGPVLPDRLHQLFVRRLPLWKRSLDLIGSLIGMVLLLPVFLAITLLIKVVSPGPVLFKQQRVGLGGTLFPCLKFRTMALNADPTIHKEYLERLIDSSQASSHAGDPMRKLPEDPRIIKGGHFLRASGLDELPQLINVFLGQMSIVGPRPPIPYEVKHYPQWFNARFDTVPGLTGLWQVSGKNRLGFNEMIRLDIRYATRRSFLMDIKIILMTPYAVYRQITEMKHNRESLQRDHCADRR